MELRYYRYFLAVAEELHFGRAADRLHIAQPALSIQIRELERMVGGPLFERTSRSVKLTAAGVFLRQEAGLVLEQEERTFQKIRRMVKGQAGVLKLAYTGTAVFSGLLGDILKRYRAEFPEVEVRLREMDPNGQLAELESGKIQAGFMTTSFLSPPAELKLLPLSSWPMLLALPAGHRLAGQKKISVEMLKEERFIAYAGEDYESVAMLSFIAGFKPKAAFEASSIIIMAAMVEAGLGVALVPEWLTGGKVKFNVVYKPVAEIKARMDYGLAFRRNAEEVILKSFLRFAS